MSMSDIKEENNNAELPCPWMDGYWVPKIEGTHFVHQVKGPDAIFKNLAQMDFPDMPDQDMQKGKWRFGDFGEAHEELQEMTGKSNYNFQMSYFDDSWIQKGTEFENHYKNCHFGDFLDFETLKKKNRERSESALLSMNVNKLSRFFRICDFRILKHFGKKSSDGI